MRLLAAIALLAAGCGTILTTDESGPAPDGGAVDAGAADAADASTTEEREAAAASVYSDMILGDSPLLYWRLGETDGTRVADSSGNGLDGTHAAGGVLLGQPSLVGDTDPSVALTPGASIDGPTDTRLAFASTAAFTVECWIAFDTAPDGERTILARATEATSQSGWELYLVPDGSSVGVRAYFARFESGAGVMHATDVNTPLQAGRPHHLVATYDSAGIEIWLDGLSGGRTNSEVPLSTHGGLAMRVGRTAEGKAQLSARVDEIAIYGYALPQARIQAHHAQGARR